jgi:hypothetical protein
MLFSKASNKKHLKVESHEMYGQVKWSYIIQTHGLVILLIRLHDCHVHQELRNVDWLEEFFFKIWTRNKSSKAS